MLAVFEWLERLFHCGCGRDCVLCKLGKFCVSLGVSSAKESAAEGAARLTTYCMGFYFSRVDPGVDSSFHHTAWELS